MRKKETLCTPQIYAMKSSREREKFFDFSGNENSFEKQIYERLRIQVPIIDACISKIIRLTGNFTLKCDDEYYQNELDDFVQNVRVGISGQSLYSFVDCYLDSLLTYGNAIGEILFDANSLEIAGLYNADSTVVRIKAGENPLDRQIVIGKGFKGIRVAHPERLVFTALNPTPKNPEGISILRGLPDISAVLLRIYECIGQNFDRIGNVRYAVTYKPTSDATDKAFAKERALQIAQEWSDGMNASKDGQVRDFIAVGDVGIKVIGAENQTIDTNIPVRQLIEQIVAKLSIPPFLLGLNWSTTERMSKQQADILTSELEFYRRLLTPVILKIANMFLRQIGADARAKIHWENINLQDECELAQARLHNAQARKLEIEIENMGRKNN